MAAEQATPQPHVAPAAAASSGLILGTLAAGQFLMTLDSSVMNVSMPTVAADLGTTITGIQTAITLYTLVMATLMITGGKLGTSWAAAGRWASAWSSTPPARSPPRIAPNLTVLLIGWSLLEGIGAALIMPAIVALVASQLPAREARRAPTDWSPPPGAVAVAAGPLIGGAVTTYASWRYVFFGEVVIVLAILAGAAARSTTSPPTARPDRPDRVGAVGRRPWPARLRRAALRRMGLGHPKPGAPILFGRLADDLADRGRPAGAVAVPALGGARVERDRRRAAGAARRCCATGSSPAG